MKILVIRFNAVGDVVLTSALCATVRKSFPDAQIDYLMGETIAPLYQNNPIINNVLFFTYVERKNPLKFLIRVMGITSQKYDVILDVSSTGRSELISLFSQSSKYRIGRLKKGRGFFYTHKKELLSGIDKITARLALLEPLIESGVDIQYDKKMSINITDAEHASCRKKMATAGVDFNRPVFAFHVSSKKRHKVWPLEYMADVVQYCIDKYDAQIVLCAGLEHEKLDVEKVYGQLVRRDNVFTNIEIKSLRELASTLNNCHFFVGNEGGPRHIAHALGLPTVSVFSPSSSRIEWLPEAGKYHKGIEWQDIPTNSEKVTQHNYKNGDAEYLKLYNTIEPKYVTPLIDSVIKNANIIGRHKQDL